MDRHQHWLLVFLNLLQKPTQTIAQNPASIIDAESYVGCFVDRPTRTLPGPKLIDNNNNNNANCMQYCKDRSYHFAGTEFGNECRCGNDTYWILSQDVDSFYTELKECFSPCTGDGNEICGGGWRLSVYLTGFSRPSKRFNLIGNQPLLAQPYQEMIIPDSDLRTRKMKCALLCDRDISCNVFSMTGSVCEMYIYTDALRGFNQSISSSVYYLYKK